MATLNVTGRLTLPNSPQGASSPIQIGTPTVPATSTSGYSLTYNEVASFEYVIAASTTKAVNFGSISTGKFLYVGVDQPVTFSLNSGTEDFAISAGGFILMAMCSLTGIEITAGAQEARVFVMVLGD